MKNHERPRPGDQGKRVWVWELPGSDTSQIKTGVLEFWNDEDLQMKSGALYPWVTMASWGYGDPPKATN